MNSPLSKTRAVAFTFTLALTLETLSCITVNINFPTAEVEDAADEIIDDVRPPIAELETEPETRAETPAEADGVGEDAGESGDGTGRSSSAIVDAPSRVRLASFTVLMALASPAQEKKIESEFDDPVVKAIRATLKKRYPALLFFYKRGAVGESRKGTLEQRDVEKLDAKERRTLRALLRAENRDRKKLYERILVLNEIDESQLETVARIFAAKWISKCESGWWIQDESGKWVRKAKKPRAPLEL